MTFASVEDAFMLLFWSLVFTENCSNCITCVPRSKKGHMVHLGYFLQRFCVVVVKVVRLPMEFITVFVSFFSNQPHMCEMYT